MVFMVFGIMFFLFKFNRFLFMLVGLEFLILGFLFVYVFFGMLSFLVFLFLRVISRGVGLVLILMLVYCSGGDVCVFTNIG
jgi:hypothetical protein